MTAFTLFQQGAADVLNTTNTGAATFGMEFSLSQACPLTGIWFYSAAGATALPSACVIYEVSGQSQVSGTLNSSPSWSGAAGSGWVKCSYSGSVTLQAGTDYRVCVFYGGGTAWFAQTNGYWASGDDGENGIVNGPLSAPDAAAASDGGAQCAYSTAASLSYPSSVYETSNYWLDVEVTASISPGGPAWRLWPHWTQPPTTFVGSNEQFVLGMQFSLSEAAPLTGIWHFSPPGVTALPSRCAIWDVSTQTEVPGTDNSSPSWSGAAGSGWVKCSYSGTVTLQAGVNYVVTVNDPGGTGAGYPQSESFWDPGKGAGGSGYTNGPISAPAGPSAVNGQDVYAVGDAGWVFPAVCDSGTPFFYPNYWVDVEVTPAAGGSGLLMAAFP